MNLKKNLTITETFALAVLNHKKSNLKIAEKLYVKTLKINPNYFDAYNNLGILHNQLGEYRKAMSCFEKAVKIEPKNAGAQNNLGFVFKELGEYLKAKSCYDKAIQIQPNAAAYNNLGFILKELGEYQQSIISYKRAIKINPKNDAAHYNLANTLKELGEYKKAINCYNNAIEINPKNDAAHFNLANTFKKLGEYKKAINFYEKAININPDYIGAHNNLGSTYEELGKHEKAMSSYEKVIQIAPNYVDAYNNLGNVFKLLGEHKKATSYYERAIEIEPKNLTSHWLSMNNFPVVYKNEKEIDSYRKRFKNSIKKINKLLDAKSQYTKKNLTNTINSSTNFYLHYQGEDVLDLQQQYASLIERITHKIYKELNHKRKKKISLKYFKIGFVSSFFRNHTVSKLFKNWIFKLDQRNFKKFVYYADNKFDHVTKEIRKNADYFFNNTETDHLIKQIYNDNLDVLIYLDIGMVPKIQILASLRLAPLQFNTWGHPITSGFKNIDYYLSGELMESKSSQNHYTEKLINLPGLGINYDFPDLSNIKKPDIITKNNSTIFLNLQSLFKLLPQDDHIYLEIVKKHPNCYFWFISATNNSLTSLFKNRISKLFMDGGYNFDRYFYFHSRCTQNEFLGLIKESDIILDTLNWSGGNTSLEAVSLNKPIVTLPSNFMRGRHTSGILKTLNIEETIADTKEKYVEIAVKLANDINFRNSIISKIKKNKKKLFNDNKPIKFLEEIIRKQIKLKNV